MNALNRFFFRLMFAQHYGFLLAMAFLRWDWLPETPEGRMAAVVIALVIEFFFSYIYIRPCKKP